MKKIFKKKQSYILAASIIISASFSTNSFGFELTSSDIQEGEKMAKTFEFSGFGCDGGNLSPQLTWSDAPMSTKSFAITAYDPDAPTGSGWWHWVSFNIPAEVTSLSRGADLQSLGATELTSDYGSIGFGGACPPEGHGMHRYQFTIWALPVEKLELNDKVSSAIAGYTLNSMAIGTAKLTATYNR
ncbi:YbhB/YbcL family Raf kinase inhibitor-like protein [Marinomonas colpomeniae]|uniref:YbhB/YbcL family Raf kinase inhibitor-like protein n=1 Tax=Marinomonas colpomeniae TaxID=2774408 RepID=A0ABR8NZ66_9GAMM|nr:YbhB/YbcL family Raf kinase inhibitor-like protein [Marinomonas colpomeniae]MBD5770372.1 YbhB/YbcL family Raf kinase inhibitor-like protein [Marinomonas colpomeniae]